MFDSFNNCLIVVRYGFNLVFVVRMVLDVRLNWLYDVKKEKPHPIANLAGKKHNMLSKAHYCLGISRLLLRWLLKYNLTLITWLWLIQQFKDKNLTFKNMLCLFSARGTGGWRPKTTNACEQPEKTINIKYLWYLVRLRDRWFRKGSGVSATSYVSSIYIGGLIETV